MYSVKSPNHEKKAAKGVSGKKKISFEYVIYCFYLGYVRNNLITHEEYKKCLFNETDMCHAQTRIGQKGHQLHTIETKKTSLSPFNDKRYKTKN